MRERERSRKPNRRVPPPARSARISRTIREVALAEVDEVELTIEKLVAGGDGLGRSGGVPIFVPRTAPGDRARVRIRERHPDYARAELVELLAPGPGRREPPCPHFGECGGCDLQHLEERVQLRSKCEATLETLRRLSGLELPSPRSILAGASWGYRIRTQLHVAAKGDEIAVGYHARGSHRIVAVSVCPILEPRLEREVTALSGRLRPPVPQRLELALGDDGSISAAPPTGDLVGGEVVRRVGEFDYHFDARTFFQGHGGLLARLVGAVVGEWRGATALDLYGGVGLFALPLARRYEQVTLVESDRIATRYALRNAREAGAANLEVVNRAVASWLPAALPDRVARVLVDPPRDGLDLVTRRLLVARPAERLTYASCHPAVLARDLRELAESFAVESIDLADLFPQTGHLEVVVQLVRKAKG